MNTEIDLEIRMIPVKQINVLNPRSRGQKKFSQIVANIAKLGLKKPITVSVAEPVNGQQRYNLVCGQGCKKVQVVKLVCIQEGSVRFTQQKSR